MMEIKDDIDNIYDEITRQANEHINQKDVILTYSQSDLLHSFLTAAWTGEADDTKVMSSTAGLQGVEEKKGKQFEVIVCETAPFFSGHKTAAKL